MKESEKMETVIEDINPRIAQPPKTNGMFVVSIGHIALSQIEGMKGTNEGRELGTDAEKVNGHMRNIKDGNYIGEHHVPPVVRENGICPKTGLTLYKLIDGEHRFQAHTSLARSVEYNVTHMWVAVCVFDNYEAISNYKSNANNHRKTYVANERTEKDICITIKNIIVEMGYSLSDTRLNKLLDNQHVAPSDHAYYRSQIKKLLDVNTNVVQTLTSWEANREGKLRHPNGNFVVQSYHRDKDAQEENAANVKAFQLKINANDPSLPVYIVAHAKKQDEKGLLKMRPQKDINFDVWLTQIIAIADCARTEGFTKPVFDWLDQTKKELGVV